MEATIKPWALSADGRRVDKIILSNGKGMEATLATWGATVLSVKVPNKAGVAEEVTLCYDKLEDLAAKSPYYGATVGRVANRIAKGKFAIGEDSYKLATNNGPNALHGGVVGFDKVRCAAVLGCYRHSCNHRARLQHADAWPIRAPCCR